MRRFLRLLALWLIALALPLHGAQAATGMAGHAVMPSHEMMTMPDGSTMEAAAMPGGASAGTCHDHDHALGHDMGHAGCCGQCCGPVVAQHQILDVAPVAARWATLPRAVADAASPQFLTDGTDRPPRPRLA